MDINSIINWHPGMELTSEFIKNMYDEQSTQYVVAVRAALGSVRLGLVPGAPFDNKGTFVRNTFEMPHFRCMAMLASGKVIDVDETVHLSIPMLYGSEYYLTVSFGKEMIPFEHKGVSYERPSYAYAIKELGEITEEMFPVVRFTAKDGVLNYDENYIPPTLQLADIPRFMDYISHFTELLDVIAKHPNIDKDMGYRNLLSYRFMLGYLRATTRTSDFIMVTQEIVQTIDYFIFSQVEHENPVKIPEPNLYDISKWLDWVNDYLKAAIVLLEKVVPEDNSIDIDALKDQIMKELYEKLYNDLHAALLAEIKEELTAELTGNLKDVLMAYMNDELKPAILKELKVELSDSLYEKLYKALYDALFEALNIPRPVEEEDTFMPLI